MRTLVCLLICTIGCLAQSAENQVLAVYSQMEKAEQTGDASTFVGLWSRESASNAEKMRPYLRARPDAHYTSSKVLVQGDDAVLLGQIGKAQFLSMRLVKEDGRWKIKDQLWSDNTIQRGLGLCHDSAAAGAFERAGSPWQNAAPAFDAAEAAKKGWQVRATFDESYLYIRIESPTPLPAPGSTLQRPPSGWPVMKVGVAGVGEFVLYASADIGDQATFDKSGRANSHRPFVAYSLRLERGGQLVFQANCGAASRSAGSGRRPLFRRARSAADDGRHGCEAHENHDRRRAVAEERTFQSSTAGISIRIGRLLAPDPGAVLVMAVRAGCSKHLGGHD